MNWVANEIHFVIVPKRGGTLAIFMHYWIDFEKYSCTIGLANLWAVVLCKYSCHSGTLSIYTSTMVKVGGGIDPATEAIILG